MGGCSLTAEASRSSFSLCTNIYYAW